MKKNLLFFSVIYLTLSILTVCWMTDGFTKFDGAGIQTLMPIFWGFVLMACVFEPLLLQPPIILRTSTIPCWELIFRGILCGILVFGIWVALIYLGDATSGYGITLILVGAVLANLTAYFAISVNNNRDQTGVLKPRLMDRKVIERIWGKEHVWVPVEAKEFTWLDLEYYDNCQRELETHGFRCLGDREDQTLKGGEDDLKTFVRVFASSDGAIQAGVYHPRPSLWKRLAIRVSGYRLGKTCDLETEFSDEVFVSTNNSKIAGLMTPSPCFEAEYYDVDTTIEQLLKRHQERIEKRIEEFPNIEVVKSKSSEDLWESQARMHRGKMDFYLDLYGVKT